MQKILITTLFLFLTPIASADIHQSIDCLAKNIYFEARGEPHIGQVAVAHVTLNRANSAIYPDTICQVVYQKNQFSWTTKHQAITNQNLYQRAKQIAHDAIMGLTDDPTNGSVSFHNKTVKPNWKKKVRAKIGNHIFYK
jgi:spore germination cell wall hydrolase CwlJ-like protein